MRNVICGRCVKCGREYEAKPDLTNCACGGILDIIYDYDYIKTVLTKEKLRERPQDMWRYRELLPVEADTPAPPLRVGWSPLYEADRLAKQLGIRKLWVKDDGVNPTASLKDRASSMAVAKAREAGAEVIACSSTGNAASSLAGNAAAAGIQTYIFVPSRAPKGKVAQLMTFGATVISVQGSYEDTFELSKVNFVKIREPLICRAMGRAILEAEVVGTADGEGMPLLCPLKDRDIAVALFRSLLPEFQCDAELKSQSKVSLYAITLWMAVTLAVSVGLFYLVMYEVPMEYAMFVNAVFVLVLAFTLGWGLFAYRIRRFSMTDTIALLVTGSFDRISNYVLIDKVQFADIRTSPVMRRTGTARCSVNMLSTMGYSNIRSGVFDLADLEALPATVLGRIKDGRYDFKKYQ